MRWIFKLLKYLIEIKRRSQIPPLPRMAAADYSSITPDEARVMIRYGIRSPSGLKTAMRKHEVDNLDALVLKLEHYQATRKIRWKWLQGIKRLSGGTVLNPHTKQIKRINPTKHHEKLLQERINRLKS